MNPTPDTLRLVAACLNAAADGCRLQYRLLCATEDGWNDTPDDDVCPGFISTMVGNALTGLGEIRIKPATPKTGKTGEDQRWLDGA